MSGGRSDHLSRVRGSGVAGMTIFLSSWAPGVVPSAVPDTGQNLASWGACSPQPGHTRTG